MSMFNEYNENKKNNGNKEILKMFLELRLSTTDQDKVTRAGYIDLLSEVEIIAQLKLVRALVLAVQDWQVKEIPKEAILETLDRIHCELLEQLDLVIGDEVILRNVVIEPPKREIKGETK